MLPETICGKLRSKPVDSFSREAVWTYGRSSPGELFSPATRWITSYDRSNALNRAMSVGAMDDMGMHTTEFRLCQCSVVFCERLSKQLR